MKIAMAGIAVCAALVACAPVPATVAQPPAPTAASATPAPALEPKPPQPEHRLVLIRALPCADLLRSSQDDRAAAAMFYLGYGEARLGRASIDTGDVEGLVAAALDGCARNPNEPAATAFIGILRDARAQ
jgi:hypothetical protein